MPAFTAALLGIMMSVLAQPAPFARSEALALRSATPNLASVPCYAKFELLLDLSATYENPFNPEDIDVWAVFTPPAGKAVRVNGFLGQAHARKLDKDTESITATGEAQWMLRFAPTREGRWTYAVHARDRSGETELPAASFEAMASESPGYLRIARNNPRVFAFDNGRPFFLVGENMCWAWKRGTYDFEDWLAALGKNGGNWIRIWMASWNCALEWTGAGFYGAGTYNLANAWKLDTILDCAEQNGIYTMLCFGTYGEFTTGGFFNEGQWNLNPYNSANGGPCAKPADFWRNDQARRLYQRRLRYIAARYGWRTGIHAWEFWNEAHATSPWVEEMAQCLKGEGPFQGRPADAFGHLVSTTYGNPKIWKLPVIDFTMTHHYGKGDIPDSGPVIHDDAQSHLAYGKPHLMAEFGIDYRKADNEYDPEFKGVNLHNGLWASVVSGNAGGAANWWWDSYVPPGNLYGQYAALRNFVEDVPWAEGPWETLDADAPSVPQANGRHDLVLSPACAWEKCPTEEFTISPRRGACGAALPGFLYSPAKPELRTRPAFHVDFEQPGRFEVLVDGVSASATLRFLLDGATAHELTLSAAPPADPNVKPDYESTEFKPEYGIHQARFNKSCGLDVPAGKHTILLEVTEGDWLSVSSYTLTGYSSNRFPKMNLYGLRRGGRALLWAQNADHHWKNVFEKKSIASIQGAITAVHGLPDGEYTIAWYDTWKGELTKTETANSTDGVLPLAFPDIATDIAAKILPKP